MTSNQALPDSAKPLSGVLVLCVEDNSDVCELVKIVLERAGAKVITASSVREAIEAIGLCKPAVLVADINLADGDGYLLIHELRNMLPEEGGQIPAIALTGYLLEQMRCLKAGYQAYIPKPFDPAELVSTVASLTRKK